VFRLCDKRGKEAASHSWPHWRWEVTIGATPGDTEPGISAPTIIRLAVTGYRLSAGAVDSGESLALFRHMVVNGLHAMDPHLVVIGGQHAWDDSWWGVPEPLPAQS
jgi:hypothetical protein